jgi:GNAT superfamily N-acetyltransferase
MIVLQKGGDGAPTIMLQPMPPDAARELAAAFAAIEPWRRYPFSVEAMRDYLAGEEPNAPRLLLTSDRVIAGAIGIRWRWLSGPYLQFLGVLPAFQNRGLGQLMLAWLEGMARASGETNLWVAASDFNTDALRFYERHGFKRLASIDELIKPDRTEILLRKRLLPIA